MSQREEDYYAEALRRAVSGDNTDARELLHGFCHAVEQGWSIPKPILGYLYSAFASYLSGAQKLDDALLLVKHRGRPERSPIRVRDGRIYTDIIIAALVSILVKRGLKRTPAIDLLWEHRIAPPRSAKRFEGTYNLLKNHTTADLHRLIRDERETSKANLTAEQREKLIKGRIKHPRRDSGKRSPKKRH